MGRNRKKSGVGAVTAAPAPPERGGERVRMDRAFNQLPVDRIIQELRDNVSFNLPDVEDTYRERDTGFSIDNRQEMQDFIDQLMSAKRQDGSWDMNALDAAAQYFQDAPSREVFFPDNKARIGDFGEELAGFLRDVRQAYERGGDEAVRQLGV